MKSGRVRERNKIQTEEEIKKTIASQMRLNEIPLPSSSSVFGLGIATAPVVYFDVFCVNLGIKHSVLVQT